MSVVKKYIIYPGIEKPRTIQEITVEILGLKNAIAIANELISRYDQALAIANINQEHINESQTKSTFEEEQGKRANEGEDKNASGS
jgi:hypothetical protein